MKTFNWHKKHLVVIRDTRISPSCIRRDYYVIKEDLEYK